MAGPLRAAAARPGPCGTVPARARSLAGSRLACDSYGPPPGSLRRGRTRLETRPHRGHRQWQARARSISKRTDPLTAGHGRRFPLGRGAPPQPPSSAARGTPAHRARPPTRSEPAQAQARPSSPIGSAPFPSLECASPRSQRAGRSPKAAEQSRLTTAPAWPSARGSGRRPGAAAGRDAAPAGCLTAASRHSPVVPPLPSAPACDWGRLGRWSLSCTPTSRRTDHVTVGHGGRLMGTAPSAPVSGWGRAAWSPWVSTSRPADTPKLL